MRNPARTLLPFAPISVAVALAMMSTPRRAVADSTGGDPLEKAEKCTTRVFAAMVGEGAPPEALGKADPLASFDALVKDARFQERFSCFINSQFNLVPGATPAEDAAYYMAKYVLGQDKPWTEMFVGRYRVNPSNGQDATSEATVSEDPDGLGYFRSRAWMVRYAGNEAAGARIVAAYRMMQNTIGLQLTATTNAPAADLTANGRKAAQCASCHYDPWFALDKIAAVLGTKTGSGDNAQFTASAAGPQTILGGVTISNDRELVEALVANEAFDVNACRLAYKYLYGRPENACEGPAFDACVDAFKKDRKITSAVAAIVKDPTFCE